MNGNVENDFFGFPKVKWLHLTVELDCRIIIRRSGSVAGVHSCEHSCTARFWQRGYMKYCWVAVYNC